MSVAAEERKTVQRSRCPRVLWTVFPHVCLILSLVVYGGFGALVFCYFEGRSNITRNAYDTFLETLVNTVKNSVNSSDTQELLMKKVDEIIREKFKPIWLQNSEMWNFFGSLFFCCTVFTTIGYGQIYPVTLPGKLFCMAYAMVGIPLMLLVITDVGDILAVLLSRGYHHLHQLCQPYFCSCSYRRCREKPVEEVLVHGGSYMFRQDMPIRQPMDIKEVLRQQTSVKLKSNQLQNSEIFNHIISQENFTKSSLQRSLSCPELNTMSQHKDIWNYMGTGQELEKLDVPMLLILVVVFAYILFIGIILPQWEKEIDMFDAIYFSFITLTTIGFGDIVPNHPKYFMLTSLFIICGMAIMSMAFKLGQNRIISCCRKCMQCISGGKVKEYKFTGSS